ncbi:unnamed protein product [Adineta ricciae]|uniref:Uncharacterized protein n=1 Tax=Adineta ricciae TaxID=249248 RepID=A0A815X1B4_ADIRI|nr:unnamed protein product [Adineta ricciae]CAF1552828.1 unnamed protein product [Adineta ricciae]
MTTTNFADADRILKKLDVSVIGNRPNENDLSDFKEHQDTFERNVWSCTDCSRRTMVIRNEQVKVLPIIDFQFFKSFKDDQISADGLVVESSMKGAERNNKYEDVVPGDPTVNKLELENGHHQCRYSFISWCRSPYLSQF